MKEIEEEDKREVRREEGIMKEIEEEDKREVRREGGIWSGITWVDIPSAVYCINIYFKSTTQCI